MKYLPFVKFEAIGNNFVLVDALDMPEMDWPSLAVKMCNHHMGVGADGLLVLLPSKIADFRMRMFNPDGTEDACGNGLRSMAAYVSLAGKSTKQQVDFETIDGIRNSQIVEKSDNFAVIRVNMGRPSFSAARMPAELPVEEVVDYPLSVDGSVCRITCVLVGTPHAVIFAPAQEFWDVIPAVSARLEAHPAFPQRINVTWCAVESPESLRIRTWERAVGPTLGCGTGACAALAAANRAGLAGEHAAVASPGGILKIDWPGRGDILMLGPSRAVFTGMWPL